MNDVPFFSQRLSESNFSSEGFPIFEEAMSWSERICGLACLKMVAAKFTETTPSLYSLLRRGLELGAYKPGAGWIHRGLAELAKSLGMKAECYSIGTDLGVIDKQLCAGALVIASVSGGFDESKRGGHLVVVIGSTKDTFLIHHPSAWEAYEWPHLLLPREKFQRCMSERGNIIVISSGKLFQ